MTVTSPVDLDKLLDELYDAYGLIEDSVLLALRLLKQGGAPLEEQRSFWAAIERMEKHLELLARNLDALVECPFHAGPGGISDRKAELGKLRAGIKTDARVGIKSDVSDYIRH